jgi:aliphatic sulfonates family ABC transporter substrate-binding protein
MPLLTLPDAGITPLSVRAKALVFEDPRSEALLARIGQIAPSDATVLVTGETGTGKELVARHIHQLSRSGRPFLAVNCGAFSESLIESELFGHERGAFTGAIGAKPGWFECAHGGTLFLDEIGDLPLPSQVKLLRVLQEGEVVRLGSRQSIAVEVRLIAATNVDLEDAVEAGHFREDLFYRLNVAPLSLLPLRERPGDILPLARHFLEVYRQRLGTGPVTVSTAAERRLLEHAWPGNIRELENVMHHALLVCQGESIAPGDLRLTAQRLRSPGSVPPPAPVPSPAAAPTLEGALLALFEQNEPDLYARIEKEVLRQAYRYCDRNQLQTARLLGISRNVVRARLIEYGEIPGTLRGSGLRSSFASEPPPSSRSPASYPPRSAREPAVFKVGFQKLGLLPLLKARGTLEAALAPYGQTVEWIEHPGGIQLVDALEAKELSVGVVGEGPAILAQAARVPVVYLRAEPPAPEGEGIIVPKGSSVRAVSGLLGKTVAVNRASNAHYLLIRALEEAGLRYADITVRYLPPVRAREAFERAEVDAWAIWDPLLSEMEKSAEARLLRDARGLAPNQTFAIADRAFAEAHPETVDVFVDELVATARWIEARKPEEVELLATRIGVSGSALENALARGPGRELGGVDPVASTQRIADVFFELQLIPRPVRMSEARWSGRDRGGAVSSQRLSTQLSD